MLMMHRERVEQHVRHDAHEAREDDVVHVVADEHLDDGRVEVLAVSVAAMVDDDRRDLLRLGALEAAGGRDVRDDDADLRVELARGDGVEDRLEVRAAAREEHAELERLLGPRRRNGARARERRGHRS
jgi:hypothetical protein